MGEVSASSLLKAPVAEAPASSAPEHLLRGEGVIRACDGGVTLYLGPEPPEGKEGNWIRTLPDVGWFPMIRLYGPLETWIERTWKPDDVEPID